MASHLLLIMRKNILVGILSILMLGAFVVGANSLSIGTPYQKDIKNEDFNNMYPEIMGNKFEVRELNYLSRSDLLMQELIRQEKISLQDFRQMKEHIVDNRVLRYKPKELSDAAWEIYKDYHAKNHDR